MSYSTEYNQSILINCKDLIGEIITIFIVGAGKIGRGIAGTLIEANPDYIVLLQFYKKNNYCKKRMFGRNRCTKSNYKKHIIIPINKIVAIQHNLMKLIKIKDTHILKNTKPDFKKHVLFLFALYLNILSKKNNIKLLKM